MAGVNSIVGMQVTDIYLTTARLIFTAEGFVLASGKLSSLT